MCTTRLLLSPYSAGATPVMTSIDCTASWRNLIRVQAALLVGDRLVVDRELRLRVVADRMEEAVRVGHHARRRQRDDLVQAAGRGFDRQLRDQALVDVGVRRRIALEQILGVTDDLDARSSPGERERRDPDSIGTAVRTSTSRSSVWNPCAATLRWYGFGGRLLKTNFPAASVVASRLKPDTGC